MLVSSYLVFTCHQNHILDYQNQPPQNLIFRPNSSLFQNSGRPAQGGQSTDMHKRAQIELAVDRCTNQSTGLGNLELTHLVRSTGSRPLPDRPCKSQSTGTRPAQPGAHGPVSVDRPLTPVDRWSVLGRKSVFSCRKSQLFRNPF